MTQAPELPSVAFDTINNVKKGLITDPGFSAVAPEGFLTPSDGGPDSGKTRPTVTFNDRSDSPVEVKYRSSAVCLNGGDLYVSEQLAIVKGLRRLNGQTPDQLVVYASYAISSQNQIKPIKGGIVLRDWGEYSHDEVAEEKIINVFPEYIE